MIRLCARNAYVYHYNIQKCVGARFLSNDLGPKSYGPTPTSPPPSSGGNVAVKVAGGIFLVGVGGLVYLWYDKDSRSYIEKQVPYSKEAFSLIYENFPDSNKVKLPSLPKMDDLLNFSWNDKSSSKPESFAEKSVRPEGSVGKPVRPEVSGVPKPPKPELTAPKPASLVKSKEKEKPVVEEEKPSEELAVQSKEDQIKESAEAKERALKKENDLLRASLSAAVDVATNFTKDAVNTQVEMETKTRKHTSQLRKAMEEDGDTKSKDDQWLLVSRAYDAKVETLRTATKSTENAQSALDDLRVAIEAGRQNSHTRQNSALSEAQKSLRDLQYELSGAVSAANKAQSEANLVHQYRDLVAKGKKQFQKELESIMPSAPLSGERDPAKGLNSEETDALIAYAHRKIEQLQRKLAELEALEKKRIESALDKQREAQEKLADERVERELQRQYNQFQLDKQLWEVELRGEWESELRRELSRQAAAHSDHLAQVLAAQRAEVARRAEHDLRERLVREREQFEAALSTWTARVNGIEAAVDSRAALEKQARRAQEVWLAAQSLQTAVLCGKDTTYRGSAGWESRLRPLQDLLHAVELAAENEPVVRNITSLMPEKATERGVWPEEALMERFRRVRRSCRQVALLEETGFTLMQYLISRIHSLLSWRGKVLKADDPLDAVELDTFTLLASAEHYLHLGDLEQALRFMCQLTGQARLAAQDWINETRLHLEARQAAQVLANYAAAQGLGAI